MPIYAYKCDSCGHAKDVLQKISDPVLTLCPACGAAAFSKQVTAAGFHLKGSGWYATDFKGGNAGAARKGADEGGESAKPAEPAAKPADAAKPAKPADSSSGGSTSSSSSGSSGGSTSSSGGSGGKSDGPAAARGCGAALSH